MRSKIQSGIRFSKQEKDEWAWSREEVEFDIQNLLSGGGMAQVGYGTLVNYTCSCMSSGPSVYLIDTWAFLLLYVRSIGIELTAFPGLSCFPNPSS